MRAGDGRDEGRERVPLRRRAARLAVLVLIALVAISATVLANLALLGRASDGSDPVGRLSPRLVGVASPAPARTPGTGGAPGAETDRHAATTPEEDDDHGGDRGREGRRGGERRPEDLDDD
jgi:hypothetical protein